MKQFEYKIEKIFIDKNFTKFNELEFLNSQGNLGWEFLISEWIKSESDLENYYEYLFVREKLDRPKIVTLCGSNQFVKEFYKHTLEETLKGNVVLSDDCNLRFVIEEDYNLDNEQIGYIKEVLDELHKRKIDISDEILVLNVGGYIGDSTRSEIEYAKSLGKVIRYIEN